MNLADRMKHNGGAELLCPRALAYLEPLVNVHQWLLTQLDLQFRHAQSEIQLQNATPSIDLHLNRVCRLSIFWFYEAAHAQIIATSDSAKCDGVLRIHSSTSFLT